eukprot:9501438-Pyramimonas_sp.AAC.1
MGQATMPRTEQNHAGGLRYGSVRGLVGDYLRRSWTPFERSETGSVDLNVGPRRPPRSPPEG